MVTIQCGAIVFSNVQAVIFDKDGTLADSHAFLRELTVQRSQLIDAQFPGTELALLRAFGWVDDQLDPAGLTAVGTRQENEIAAAACIAQMGQDWITAKTIAQACFAEADLYLDRRAKWTPPFEEVRSLLASLVALDLKVGIVSADTEANVRDFVDCYELSSYFQLQMGVREGRSKPDPRLLEIACEELGVSPAQTIVIGDSPADIKLAHLGGAIGSVGVTWGGTHAETLRGADVVIDRFEQIQAWAKSQA
jgi:phosphoglycolate phosphatase